MIILGWWNVILYTLYGCVVGCQACEVVLATYRLSKQAHADFEGIEKDVEWS
jgi:hypothetical protein